MHPDAVARFYAFNSRFEGEVPWMYLDVKGLVTVGVGNLIDPVARATRLPFRRPDGSRASAAEIAAEWAVIKRAARLARQGAGAAKAIARLRLTKADIAVLVTEQMQTDATFMQHHYFPDFEHWPADAQLATASMAWALGAGFPSTWPRLRKALQSRRFADAATECQIDTRGNAGVAPRNAANRELYLRASAE